MKKLHEYGENIWSQDVGGYLCGIKALCGVEVPFEEWRRRSFQLVTIDNTRLWNGKDDNDKLRTMRCKRCARIDQVRDREAT